MAAFHAHVQHEKNSKEIDQALSQVSDLAPTGAMPDEQSLRNSLVELDKVGFSNPDKRQEALSLFIRASLSGKNREAANILRKTEQGPSIRLWHLNRLIEDIT